MNILLLNPPFKTEHGRYSRSSRSPAVTKSGTLYYPIWLCYVAAILEKDGHEISVIDSCAYGYDLKETLQLVTEKRPQFIVLDTSTPSIYSDIDVAKEIKGIVPESVIVLIGTHPSAVPEETLGISDMVDAVAVGEADYTVRELAKRIADAEMSRLRTDSDYRKSLMSSIDGLAYRAGDEIHLNEKRELIRDLDAIPFVSQIYHKYLDTKKYFFAASDYPEIQIMTARGCVAKCTYCVYPQTMHGWKYRVRSAQNIADEFQWITENMPEIREIGIEDDTFTGIDKRVIDFCNELIRREIKIKWYCNVRVDLKYDIMKLMRQAGCVLLTVGYESANQQILENIDKRATPDMILEFSKNTRRAGLLVHGCFMAGNRGETKETLQQSLDLSLKLMDDTMQFFPLMVYPGTKDYDWMKEKGLLNIYNYAEYVTEDGNHNGVARMPDMTSEEITEWCNQARRQYYLRPKYLAYKLWQQVRHPSEIRRTFKSAKRFIRFLLPN